MNDKPYILIPNRADELEILSHFNDYPSAKWMDGERPLEWVPADHSKTYPYLLTIRDITELSISAVYGSPSNNISVKQYLVRIKLKEFLNVNSH